MIRNIVVPAPGNVAVIREHVDEIISKVKTDDGREVAIIRTDENQEHAQRINPWALVVGVGPDRIDRHSGAAVAAPCKPGDKVLIAQVGRYIELRTPDGERQMMYVVPFEGVIAVAKWECSLCLAKFEAEPAERACPNGCQDIVRPSVAESIAVNAAKTRKVTS